MNEPFCHLRPRLTGSHDCYASDVLECRALNLERVAFNPQGLSNQHVGNDRFEAALPDRLCVFDERAGSPCFQRMLLGFQRLTLLPGPP